MDMDQVLKWLRLGVKILTEFRRDPVLLEMIYKIEAVKISERSD